ncbi:hypothetical protein [Desulfitobacterium sp.]|uniref:hypothetical protein n=1 Tax=Desulfitobacterium sp. TaxID=49981 RepID=UPI002B1E9360|nr:hypothetical protein [Desulfitobacterium sp.]MEA4900890.1 hypothetical protein [Desulfitobacterium sp.]
MKGKWRIHLAVNWGLLLLILGLILVWQPQKVGAACGASTSSCKTCHEIKGELSVSKKGDWHTQHAFGDFCQACHLGVATTNDKTQAHQGLIAKPLEMSGDTCASCHPSDTAARVAKYGGDSSIGSNPAAPSNGSASGNTEPTGQASTTVTVSAAATQIPSSENPNYDVIDFNKWRNKVSWLSWAMGAFNIILLLVLIAAVWRWKKGVWPWAYFKRKGDWVDLHDLPVEGQQLIKRLLHTDLKTVMEINEQLERRNRKENQSESTIDKEGKDHVL